MTDWLYGDWAAIWKFGDALNNLAECLQQLGINIQHRVLDLDPAWDGNASDAAYQYFSNLAAAVSGQQIALRDIGEKYHKAVTHPDYRSSGLRPLATYLFAQLVVPPCLGAIILRQVSMSPGLTTVHLDITHTKIGRVIMESGGRVMRVGGRSHGCRRVLECPLCVPHGLLGRFHRAVSPVRRRRLVLRTRREQGLPVAAKLCQAGACLLGPLSRRLGTRTGLGCTISVAMTVWPLLARLSHKLRMSRRDSSPVGTPGTFCRKVSRYSWSAGKGCSSGVFAACAAHRRTFSACWRACSARSRYLPPPRMAARRSLVAAT